MDYTYKIPARSLLKWSVCKFTIQYALWDHFYMLWSITDIKKKAFKIACGMWISCCFVPHPKHGNLSI